MRRSDVGAAVLTLAASPSPRRILTVVNTDGTGEGGQVGSGDTSNTLETVTATDIQSGHYEVQACGFVTAVDQPYTGSLVIRTTKPNSETSPAAAPANGQAFSPSMTADPQRDSTPRDRHPAALGRRPASH